jgi:hypothetical protein
VAKQEHEVQKRMNGRYQPIDYFWANDRGIRLASNIKGANRKLLFEGLVNEGDPGASNPIFMQSSLSAVQRRAVNTHPAFMGGEYLPDCRVAEVEIARIAIASTTQDVTCIYAQRLEHGIGYRAVDEYDGMTLDDVTTTVMDRPMQLSELVQFFMHAWNLCEVLEANFAEHGYPIGRVKGFIVDASSSFYSQFGQAIDKHVDFWLKTKLS